MAKSNYTVENIQSDITETYSRDDLKDFIVVEAGDFKTSRSPMISQGLCNCIALIGLSRSTALLGHFQRIDSPDLGSYEHFGEAIKTLSEIEAHSVILAGGGMFDNPVDIELATADRAFAENAARTALSSSNIVINWNEDYNGPQDIVVFPESGRIAVHNAANKYVHLD